MLDRSTPDAGKSLAQYLADLPQAQQDEVLKGLSDEQLEQLRFDWRFWARPEQILPDGEWSIWLLLAGRGWGKTRVGMEAVREWICGKTPLERGAYSRIALIAETAKDARDVLVEGPAGILEISPKDFRPSYEPSKRKLTWPNGAVGLLFNGTEPDQLRGPEHDCALVDELAKYQFAQQTWDMLQFGLRRGKNPRVIVATTPRPIPLLRQIMKMDGTIVQTGRTLDNAGNLAPAFIKSIVDRYGGTRLGRQELDAEILDDVPGALWSREMLENCRVREVPDLERIVVGVDPSTTSEEDSAETGIIVCGIAPNPDGHTEGYVLDDCSIRGTPDEWARKVIGAYRKHEADRIVAEKNQGGEMVEAVIRGVDPDVPVTLVSATRGKYRRAEPISALFEQGRMHMVGAFPQLEDQLVQFLPTMESSPDRADAMVWAFTALMGRITRGKKDRRTLPSRTNSKSYSPFKWRRSA